MRNDFGPSLASLTIRSCKQPWWEPGNCVCPSLTFLLAFLGGGLSGSAGREGEDVLWELLPGKLVRVTDVGTL